MQRKQYLVKLASKAEGDQFIDFLEQNGYKNLTNVLYDTLKVKVIVVDNNHFYPSNVTSLAALASIGEKPISVSEFFCLTN